MTTDFEPLAAKTCAAIAQWFQIAKTRQKYRISGFPRIVRFSEILSIISQKLSIFKISLYFAQNQDILGKFSLFPYNLSLLSQNTLYNLSKTLYNLSKNSQNSL